MRRRRRRQFPRAPLAPLLPLIRPCPLTHFPAPPPPQSIENYPLILALSLVSWGFPIASGFALLSWSLGRIFYFTGYSAAVDKRNSLIAALLTYPALLTLFGLSLCTAVHLFQGALPYTYA